MILRGVDTKAKMAPKTINTKAKILAILRGTHFAKNMSKHGFTNTMQNH